MTTAWKRATGFKWLRDRGAEWTRCMPIGMIWMLALGSLLSFAGVAGTTWAHLDSNKWVPHGCESQLEARKEELKRLNAELATSSKRKYLLELVLTMPDSPGFIGARTALEQEEAYATQRITTRDDLKGDPDAPIREGVIIAVAPLVVWTLAVVLMADLRRLLRPTSETFSGWIWPCAGSAGLVTTAIVLSETYASILTTEKTWFGYDSYCIDARAFWLSKLALAGGQIMAGCIVALFAVATRSDHRPRVHPREPRCGVGPYVEFAVKWMPVGASLALVFVCIWLWLAFSTAGRTDAERVAYLTPLIAAAIPVAVLFWRLIHNMQVIRERYESACQALRPNEPRPSDPTKPFFEDKPWRVPATLVTLVATAWAVLHFLGVATVLLP